MDIFPHLTKSNDNLFSIEQFWINHAQERITELRPVLQDVARFLRMSPSEVVIVDFHRFPVGFSGKFQQSAVRHRWLANLINEELGELAAQVSSIAKIKIKKK